VVEISGGEARHAAAVLRLGPGEPVLLSDGLGVRAWGTVLAATGGPAPRLAVAVDRVAAVPRRVPQLALDLAWAMGRRDEAAVAAATQLGADRVIPWQANRSVPRWDGAKAARGRERWGQITRTEGKVARLAWLPVVEDPVTSAALAARLEAEIDENRAHAIVLHEDAAAPFAEAAAAAREAPALFLVVGPEGSIAPEELEAFRAAGARTARLGPEVLRTGLAGAVALALASHVVGRW
jgi:16S rRNA (uracil1498-N3)-methyltransferase